MTADPDYLAAELLELTKRLKASVETGSVDDLESLQQERERVMRALFNGLDGVNWRPGWISVVQEVQALNQELVALARSARDTAGRELASLKRMRRAESAYVDTYDNMP